MSFLFINPRASVWFVRGFLAKKKRFLGLGFLFGLALSLYWLSGFSLSVREIFVKENSAGLVGKYNQTNLPISIQNKISLGLTKITADDRATAAASLNWKVESDGKKYTFNLNPNLFWHDGTKFKSFDINYRLRDVEIIARGADIVEFKLKEALSSLPSIVSQPLFKKGLTGLGQYEVRKISYEGAFLKTLELINTKNKTDRLIYKFYNSEEEAILALKLKKVSRLEGITNISSFLNRQDYNLDEITDHHEIVGLFYNTKKPPFDVKTTRLGLSYTVPDDIKLKFTVSDGPIPATSWYFNTNLKEYSFSETQAQKYLKELLDKGQNATLSAEFKIRLDTLPVYKKVAEQIARSWTDLGITTTVNETTKVLPDYDVFLAAIEVYPDPDQYYLWHSTQKGNITGYNNPRIDKLLEDGRSKTFDEEERRQKYLEFQRYLTEENPALFLFYGRSYTISRL